jgi:Fe-S-cluster-containing hydrogenase component 2
MSSIRHSLRIDEEKCVGCVLCMKACPTRAIRVRNDKAVINGEYCVDCGECYRVCPHDAVVPQTTSFSGLKKFKYRVAVPSPVLYTQFRGDVMPNQVLLALKKIGFEYVVDVAWMCEQVAAAYQVFLREHPRPRPMISTVCPAIVRLIAYNYPELASHVMPIDVPREVVAKRIRKKIAEKNNIRPEDIAVLHITPCSAKMVSINNPIGLARSHLSGAIAISDIYGKLLEVLDDVEEDIVIQQSSGVGLAWAMSGGEILGMRESEGLAVSGVRDAIQILDDLEAGKLRGLDYLECLVCPDGCLGGPMAVENRHVARKRCEALIKMFGEKSRVSEKMIRLQYREGLYTLEKSIEFQPHPPLDKDPVKAIQKHKKIEELIPFLGGKECGACGAPDCRSLARDIVMGDAKIEDCVFIKRTKKGIENET